LVIRKSFVYLYKK